jgi:hypothetical protein
MLLSARGGRGGTGQIGQPGADGDPGGPGADYKEIDSFDPAAKGFSGATNGGDGGNAGNGGAGGAGGPGGNGGAIFVSIRWGDEPSRLDNMVAADKVSYTVVSSQIGPLLGGWAYRFFVCNEGGPVGEGGAGGEVGSPGNGGPPGDGFAAWWFGSAGEWFSKQDEYFEYQRKGKLDDDYKAKPGGTGDRGNPGGKGFEDPKQVGEPGTVSVTTKAEGPKIASLCRAEHLQMVFDRVGCLYLSIDLAQPDQQSWKLIGDTLAWLKLMLSNYPTERPGKMEGLQGLHVDAQWSDGEYYGGLIDDIKPDTYEYHIKFDDGDQAWVTADQLRIDRAIAAKPVPVPESEVQWVKHLADQVTALQINHANGYDYFGKSVRYAPALSLDTYDSALTSSLNTLLRLETKRNELKKQLDKSETQVAKLDDAQAEAEAAHGNLRDKLDKIHRARGETRKTIDSQGKNVEIYRQQLSDAMRDLTKEVNAAFGTDAEHVIGALSQVAFMGTPLAPKEGVGPLAFSPLHAINSSVLLATQIASIIDQGAKSVLNDSGEPVQKSYILKQLNSSEATITLNQQVTKINADDSYKIDTDGATKLVSTREKLDECLRDFSKHLTKSQDVIQKFRQYTDAVTTRIQSMADYNDLLTQEYQAASVMGQWTAKAQVLKGKALKTEGKLQIKDVMYWIDGLHQAIKLICLSHLHMLDRANTFWAPKVYSGIRILFGGEIRQIDHAALAAAQSTSRSNLLASMEKALSTPVCFPSSKHGPGVLFPLTPTSHPEVFEDLRYAPKKSTCTITIASPAVITLNSHGLGAGQIVQFTTTGSLPTGISSGKDYYVTKAGLTNDAFEISAAPEGSAISTSGSQSGTHTCTPARYAQTVSFDIPVADYAAGKDKTPFHGMANVRLTSVRPYFIGLKGDDTHTITIAHGGDEIIQGPDDRPYTFSHGRRAIRFVSTPTRQLAAGKKPDDWEAHVACYDIKEAGTFGLPLSIDTKAPLLPAATYAPIGPFTHWKMVIEYKDYNALDLSGVTAIILDFRGFHQTFNDAIYA